MCHYPLLAPKSVHRTLNYLIGKEDFETAFRFLIKEHPEVVEVIPALVVRLEGERKGSVCKKFELSQWSPRMNYLKEPLFVLRSNCHVLLIYLGRSVFIKHTNLYGVLALDASTGAN